MFPLKAKEFVFFLNETKGIIFLKRCNNHFKIFWGCVLCWKVLLTTKVVPCQNMELKWWTLLRMSKMQSVLPRLEHLLWKPKTDTDVVWWRCYVLFCQKEESWLRKRKTISFSEEISPLIAIGQTRACTKKRQEAFPSWHNRVDSPMLDAVNQTFNPFSFITLSVYGESTWFFQSPTTVLIGLLTFDQDPLHWM